MNSLLERIGWSKAYFARHMGVTEKTVYNWGVSEPVDVMKYLELMARLMNV